LLDQTVNSAAQTGVRKTAITACILGCVALFLFLWRVNVPPIIYYDEPQYVDAARAFLVEAPNPNPIAPPLGKLLIAASMKVLGDNPRGWRSAGAVCGAITLVAVFLWSQLLLQDYALALTAALLTLLNNFLFVMARIAMMDIFLVTFVILGVLAFTAAAYANYNRAQRCISLLAAGVSLGLACACKWNGIDSLAVVAFITFALVAAGKWWHNAEIQRCRANLAGLGIPFLLFALAIAPVVAYSVTYWPLCRSTHRPFNLSELIAQNVFIWRFHIAVVSNPAIASRWYSWLFQVSPQRGLSYLVGNWAVMWGGLLALAFCARRLGRSFPHTLLVLLYTANLLQWAVTPQKMKYYYYYFPAAMFLGVAIALALRDLPQRLFGIRLSILCLIPAACIFLFCFAHMAHLESPFDCALGCWP
jgi:dolichyl-phosphate-mannose-protein mannosyltransferase